jgi:ATP-dependent RNA helicase RhlE
LKTFSELGLPQALVASLEAGGFTTPTKIQHDAIPQLLKGRDMLGIAQTGSGKTAAFGLPILTALMAMEGKARPMSARALILAPTRELAVQIEEAIRSFAGGAKKLSTVLVLGGVSRYHQVQKIAKGVDVMVATPGRLMDLMDDKKVWLNETKFLVLDEADRMLDMGFIGPVKAIAKAIGHERQTMLFSATMADNIADLAKGLLKDPIRVEASPQGSTVIKIDQRVILSGSKAKRGVLNELLADESLAKVIIFSRTKHGADKVVKNLTIDGHSAAAIHGNKSQNARQAALKGFTSGAVRLLVATDIAARGIDVPNITHVINYELPDDAENYVHRIGRTGRNGASGSAITLVDGTERSKLRDIERLIRRTLPVSGDLSLANSTGVKAAPAGMRDEPARSGPRTQRNPKARQTDQRPQSRRADRAMGSFAGLADDLAGRGDGARDGKPAGATANGAKKPRWNRDRKQAAKGRPGGGNGGPPRRERAARSA